MFKTFISKFFNKAELSTSKDSFEVVWNDLGVFEYQTDEFKIHDNDLSETIKWNTIKKIVAYKKDLFTVDLIVMEIVHVDKVLIINEELAGWFQFVLKSKEVFPEIPKDWDLKIMHPAFEENYTVLFEKKLIEFV